MNAVFRLSLILIVFLLSACGASSTGGGTDLPVAPVDEPIIISPVKVLSTSEVSFQRHLDTDQKISLPYPSHWESQRVSNDPNVLYSFREKAQSSQDDYREQVQLIKVDSESSITGPNITNIQEDSSAASTMAGMPAQERIFLADEEYELTNPLNVAVSQKVRKLKFLQISLELNGSLYALLYSAEEASFERNIELVRYMARYMEIAQIVVTGYDLNSDLSRPGKTAIASDGENFLFISCRQQAEISNRYDLIARLVKKNRSMSESFIIHENIGRCDRPEAEIIFDGQQYVLVYTSEYSGRRHVLSKRISVAGVVIDVEPVDISRNVSSNVYSPDIVFDGERSLVVWHDSLDDVYDEPAKMDIRGAFLKNGIVEPIFTVVSNLQETYLDPNIYAYTAKVAMANNQFIVVWNPKFFRDTRRPTPHSIFGQLLDSNGNNILNEPLLIREDRGNNPRYINVASDGDSYTIAWVEGLLGANTDSEGSMVYARQISSTGEIIRGNGPEVGVEITSSDIAGASSSSNNESKLSKNFLELAFIDGQYIFLWSTLDYGPDGGLYKVNAEADLSKVSSPIAIGGRSADAFPSMGLFREPSIGFSETTTVVSWVSDVMEAWFMANPSGPVTIEPIPTINQPDKSLAEGVVNRSNASTYLSILNELTLFGVEIATDLELNNASLISQIGANISSDPAINIKYSQMDADNNYTVTVGFTGFNLGQDEEQIVLNGSIDFLVSSLSLFDPVATLNLKISNALNEAIEAKNLSYRISPGYYGSVSRAYEFAGQLGYGLSGLINVHSEIGTVYLSGASLGKVGIKFKEKYAEVSVYSDGLLADSGVRFTYDDYIGGNFYGVANVKPSPAGYSGVVDLDLDPRVKIYFANQFEDIEGHAYSFDVLGAVTDTNGDPLTYQVTVKQVNQIDDLGYGLSEPVEVQNHSLRQTGYSSFVLDAQVPGVYVLEVVGTDVNGLSDAQEVMIGIVADTDRDGFRDYDDYDDDNDGVMDFDDKFPKDVLESTDFDLDGIGDNADLDDDNDNVPDATDFYPLNNLCSSSADGDGTECYVEIAAQWKFFFDGQGVLYFYQAGRRDVARWNVDEQRYIEPLIIGSPLSISDELTAAIYSSSHDRVYFGFDSGVITYIDRLLPEQEKLFVQTDKAIKIFSLAGDYFLAYHEVNYYADILVFDINAEKTAQSTGLMPSYYTNDYRNYDYTFGEAYVLDKAQGLYYDLFRTFNLNTTEPLLIDLNLATGELMPEVEKIESSPVASSPDGLLSLRANGQIYDVITKEIVGSMDGLTVYGFPRGKIVWREDGISYLKDNRYWRIKYTGEVLEKIQLQGDALFEYGDQLVVVSQSYDFSERNTLVKVTAFTPSDDTDSDGVINLLDAYPNDAAASVDTDHDGYPDEWNSGYGEIDSTSDLVLDAYLNAVDCYLPVHGDGTDCDPASSLTYTVSNSDNVAISPEGILYIWRWHFVHRYDLQQDKYLSSIYVGSDDPYLSVQTKPKYFDYSATDNQIYLAYENKVSTIDLNESLEEKRLFTLDQEPSALVITNDYIVVGTDNTVSLDISRLYYDKIGNFVQQSKSPTRIQSMAWDSVSNNIYSTQWPYSVYIESLNVDEFIGEASLLAEIEDSGPLFELSLDGQYFVRRKSDIYRTSDGSSVAELNMFIKDALWLSNGNLALLANDSLKIVNSDFVEIRSVELDRPLTIHEFQEEILILEEATSGGRRYSFRSIPVN
jgi:hypothetical protein